MTSPRITEEGAKTLQTALDAISADLPCVSLTVVSREKTLFHGQAGVFDPLHQDRLIAEDDTIWFASTAKLVTAIVYLQLIDRGILTLDTPMAKYSADLAAATSQVFMGYSGSGVAIYEPAERDVTLKHLLNQTSGFGAEMGPKLAEWRSEAGRGTGWVNTCKRENLVHKFIVEQPGTRYQYGNSAEWLSYIFPSLPLPDDCPKDFEAYAQKYVFAPLGMNHSSFLPFDSDRWAGKLAPIRYYDLDKKEYQELSGQLDYLTLPRSLNAIEYPSGGGGLYSTTRDYSRLLQHLLRFHSSLDSSVWPHDALLSPTSLRSAFTPSLPESALPAASAIQTMLMTPDLDYQACTPGEMDWTSAMGIYLPMDGRPWGGYGRRAGSVFWGGVSGVIYWIDPTAGIAVSFDHYLIHTYVPAPR